MIKRNWVVYDQLIPADKVCVVNHFQIIEKTDGLFWIANVNADSSAFELEEAATHARVIAEAPEMYNMLRGFIDGKSLYHASVKDLIDRIDGNKK